MMIFDRLTYIDRRTQNNEVKQIGNPRNLGFWCQFSVSIKFIPQYEYLEIFSDRIFNSNESSDLRCIFTRWEDARVSFISIVFRDHKMEI